MDVSDLFLATRRGDFEKVRYLVEKLETPLNVRDRWDSTPLYYACYCGHKEIVQYMLANGARCEANTFDGERCIYAALTDDIRNLLRSAKVITSRVMRRHTYDEFLRKCFESTEYCDVMLEAVYPNEVKRSSCISELETQNRIVYAHKCVLASRVPFFRDKLASRPSCTRLRISCRFVEVLHSLKEFIYTGCLRMRLDNDKVAELQALAAKLRMYSLVRKLFFELEKYERERSRYVRSVRHVTVEPADHACRELADAFGPALGEEYLCRELAELSFGSEPRRVSAAQRYADVCFVVEGVQFFAHKLFYCLRSDYFVALLRDHERNKGAAGATTASSIVSPFRVGVSTLAADAGHVDRSLETSIPFVTLSSVSADVFACIHDYVYCDEACIDCLTATNVFDVLCAADQFLLTGLKKLCGTFLANHALDLGNAVTLLRCARLFQLTRLEDQCVAFIARNLEHFLSGVRRKHSVWYRPDLSLVSPGRGYNCKNGLNSCSSSVSESADDSQGMSPCRAAEKQKAELISRGDASTDAAVENLNFFLSDESMRDREECIDKSRDNAAIESWCKNDMLAARDTQNPKAEPLKEETENEDDSENDFCRLVIEDAHDVKGRQETDSIAVIDDIRYHISANVQTFSEIEEANEKLYLIDEFLYRLGLEA